MFGLPIFLVRTLLWLTERSRWFDDLINCILINRSVNTCRSRPHPWSTLHDYTSWSALTDKRYSARHLSAKDMIGLPDSGAAAELFRRRSGAQRLCPKSTCLFPTFAQYLTDGFIRTRMPNASAGESGELRKQNSSNHEIDLCPLYGRNREQVMALRERSEEAGRRGRLKSQMVNGEEYAPYLCANDAIKDEFKDLDLPLGFDKLAGPVAAPLRAVLFAFGGDRANAAPQVAAMNTLLLREHNRLASELEKRNVTWDDERVFETARAILIVCFIKVVVEEYINHIAPSPFRFKARPQVAWRARWNKPNWITAEFSLLYRWHSLVPDKLRWGNDWVSAGDGRLNNLPLLGRGLKGAFEDLSAQTAGALGPFNTTDVLIGVERSAIDQSRLVRLASYCDYRRYVDRGKSPTSFNQISSNPDVVALLNRLYKSVEDVEFYVGIFAEDTVKNSPLPELILRMVAVDAFSQALTNPLLSEHVFNEKTFTPFGMATINETHGVKDWVVRNTSGDSYAFIGMTRPDWKFAWG